MPKPDKSPGCFNCHCFISRVSDRAEETIARLASQHPVGELQLAKPEQSVANAKRQIDQIERRVMKGEAIPHDEKFFSLSESHTEWISKGKTCPGPSRRAGVAG